jgi:hypothetical protein
MENKKVSYRVEKPRSKSRSMLVMRERSRSTYPYRSQSGSIYNMVDVIV